MAAGITIQLWLLPKRWGDCTDANPFPKGYIPRIGEQFSIQRRIYSNDSQSQIIDGYDNCAIIPLYEIISIRMKIVETSQQHFQSVCYLDVKQIGNM